MLGTSPDVGHSDQTRRHMAKVSAPMYKISNDVHMTPLSTGGRGLWKPLGTPPPPGPYLVGAKHLPDIFNGGNDCRGGAGDACAGHAGRRLADRARPSSPRPDG